MDADSKLCRHQLKRPPDLVTDAEGVSHLLFECVLCSRGISLRLSGPNARSMASSLFRLLKSAPELFANHAHSGEQFPQQDVPQVVSSKLKLQR